MTMSPSHVLADVRFALRLLRRSPVFAATLLGVLILGIGATTAMFSIVVSVLLRPLPYPDARQLTMIWATQPNVDPSPVSVPDFEDWRGRATSFDGMAAVEYESCSLSSPDVPGSLPEACAGANVSGDFFPLLRVSPLHGRLLEPADDRPDGPKVVVIGAALWHRRFASDPRVVGRTIALSGEPYTVVGIAPEGFRFAGPYSNRTEVWTPLAVANRSYARLKTQGRGSHFLHVIGRRKPGVTVSQAQAELGGIAKTIEDAYPESNTKVGVRVLELHDELVGGARKGIFLLFAAVGLVFLVVCANVANLLLARAAARRSEMAARAALGATPGRLAMQLVTETIVIFLLGAGGGAILAQYLVGVFASGIIGGGGAAAAIDIRVDGAALAFSVAIAFLFGLASGLVPAAEARRVEAQTVLKEAGTRGSAGGAARLVRSGLVVAQVALAFTLLVGGGLALRDYAKRATAPLGFDPENLATAAISVPPGKFSDAEEEKLAAYHRAIIDRVATQPGVTAAGGDSTLPMSGSSSNGSFEIEGRPPWPAGARPLLERHEITPGYFTAMGIPLLRGRDFDDGDVHGGRLVMILGREAAERFFPGEDPIGRRIDWGDRDDDGAHVWREVVGIVGDVRRLDRSRPYAAESYVPFAQHPARWIRVVARTRQPEALLRDLPRIVAAVDAQQAVSDRRTMRDRVAGTLGASRFVTTLLGAFAAAALVLATIGLFGLVSYTTTQRTRELGIRLALGASPERVIGVVMREGVSLLGLGLLLGSGAAILVGRVVHQQVGAAAFDPLVLLTIFGTLGVTGTVASLLPALRAVRIPPAVALRYE
jgi:putative ABC transport system permease protein